MLNPPMFPPRIVRTDFLYGMRKMLLEIVAGIGGGALAEILVLYKYRDQSSSLPTHLKHPYYWVVTSAMIVVGGGGLVSLHLLSGATLSPLVAANIGASAPLLIGSSMKLIETPKPNRTN